MGEVQMTPFVSVGFKSMNVTLEIVFKSLFEFK